MRWKNFAKIHKLSNKDPSFNQRDLKPFSELTWWRCRWEHSAG